MWNDGTDNQELGVGSSCGPQVRQDLNIVRVTPVVYNILQDEDCRFNVLWLWSEEIMT
jgi:hypothetical protein